MSGVNPLIVMLPVDEPHVVGLLLVMVMTGTMRTVTVMEDLGPSQPLALLVWLTHQVKVPGADVVGIGAVPNAVPPVATVYQLRLWPLRAVAVNGEAASPTQ